MAELSLRGVTKSYGGASVVRDLSIDVADGELLVLVGPSGCGKTSTLRIVAGLEDHQSGEIRIGGRNVTTLPPAERDVAMVFQSYALFPHMTVFDNLGFGLAARRRPADEIRDRVAEIAGRLGLDGLLDRRPGQLSGGERQRVALGRAMVREPAVCLMDEPLSNLDAQLRTQTRAEIVDLQERLRTTTVYVTHDQVEALAMGHRMGVMRDGVLEQIGTPHEIYDAPATLFVAGFIGSPPMNLMDQHDGTVLGVRPEHVHVVGSRWARSDPPSDTVRAAVERSEPLGDRTVLTLDSSGARVLAVVEPAFRVQRGAQVEAWFDHTHRFDARTGLRL